LITSDTLVAELNLSFWIFILGARYDNILWNSHIKEVFTNTPFNISTQIIREIRKQVDHIRILRNRVSHHEPVFSPKRSSFKEMIEDYENALKIIRYLSEDAYRFIIEEDEIPSLIELMPTYMRYEKPKKRSSSESKNT